MALEEATWIAALPENVQSPARSVLDQLTNVAELIAASLSRSTAVQTIRNLEEARPRIRQVLTEAGQHVNVEELGELVANRIRLRHGEAKAQETMMTFATLVADRPGEEQVQ